MAALPQQRTLLSSHKEPSVDVPPAKPIVSMEKTTEARTCGTGESRVFSTNRSATGDNQTGSNASGSVTSVCPDAAGGTNTSLLSRSPAPPSSVSPLHSPAGTGATAFPTGYYASGSCTTADEDYQMQHFLSLLQEEFQHSSSLSTLALSGLSSFSCAFGNHEKIIGLVKSLQANEYLLGEQTEQLLWTVTPEGRKYIAEGTPEFFLMQTLAQAVANHEDLPDVGDVREHFPDVALSTAMKNGWVEIEKDTRKVQIRKLPSSDVVQELLKTVQQHSRRRRSSISTATIVTPGREEEREGEMKTVKREIEEHDAGRLAGERNQKETSVATTAEVKEQEDDLEFLHRRVKQLVPDCSPEKTLQNLKRRKLVDSKKVKFLIIQKGKKFSLTLPKRLTDVTADLIATGEWKNADLKEYNFFSSGKKQFTGGIHPLIRVLRRFTSILTLMGFEEMETNQYVEPSFWCFDALFMPQQHPSRDVQDTFFLSEPACSDMTKIPRDYVQRVRAAHENGIKGSTGWQYSWSEEEAKRNVLRTHTTATSAQLLYTLAQEYQRTKMFRPRRFFSIDRVFRNETLDATHLAEFHQVEGLVADRGLTLGHLLGVMETFYKHIGVDRLRFKPAYNPYTEPSMEIFGYHPVLKKWIEVGNSGIFRPEMLQPMGLPTDITVIAWGLSLERPTMIRYGISNIRDLFGSRALLGGV